MSRVSAKNERTKRAFFRYLKNADGCCESTINSIENAILLWQEFSKDEDFAFYNADKAIDFKKWLLKRETRGRPMALVTYHAYLRHLRKFFGWLVREPGYRSKIKPNTVDYLKVTEKEERMATQSEPRNYPSLEYVRELVDSIVIRNEIDQRDQALILICASKRNARPRDCQPTLRMLRRRTTIDRPESASGSENEIFQIDTHHSLYL
jgi:site-specific recombinase XerD